MDNHILTCSEAKWTHQKSPFLFCSLRSSIPLSLQDCSVEATPTSWNGGSSTKCVNHTQKQMVGTKCCVQWLGLGYSDPASWNEWNYSRAPCQLLKLLSLIRSLLHWHFPKQKQMTAITPNFSQKILKGGKESDHKVRSIKHLSLMN